MAKVADEDLGPRFKQLLGSAASSMNLMNMSSRCAFLTKRSSVVVTSDGAISANSAGQNVERARPAA